MDWIVSTVSGMTKGISTLLLNPFLYIFLLLAWMHYRRQTLFERKLFNRRLHRPSVQWLHTVIHGLRGGIFATLCVFGLGIVLQPFDLWAIAILSFLFSFFHAQYLSFAYGGGFYALCVAVAKLWPQGAKVFGLSWLWERLSAANLASLIGLLALFYLVASMLVRRNAGRGATPIFLNGKRGRLVGAYQLQKFWLLPMFMVVSVPAGTREAWMFPAWWPMLLAADGSSLTLIGFPVLLGFSQLMLSRLPEEQARHSARQLFRYALILMALALLSIWSVWAALFAGLLGWVGQSLLSRLNQWKQWREPPLFAQLGEGAVVLAVLPKTPAEEMGIVPGDVLVKVNEQKILDSEDLYPALQLNSAFCKMEVRNAEGHIKYIQRALYEGEHHQLGLILAPDKQTPYYVDLKPVSIVQLFNQQIDRGA